MDYRERSDPRTLLYNNNAAQAPTPLLQCESVEGGARSKSHESMGIVLAIVEEEEEEEKWIVGWSTRTQCTKEDYRPVEFAPFLVQGVKDLLGSRIRFSHVRSYLQHRHITQQVRHERAFTEFSMISLSPKIQAEIHGQDHHWSV
jgi:hypothetical protein